jgi:predicted transcriptional regulator YdeE
MSIQKEKGFHVIGISVRTTNENDQVKKDIPALWNRFMGEGTSSLIPNKTEESIYCVYTDYEKDHTKPYTTIIGCKVADLSHIPEGMTGKTIAPSNYEVYPVKGNLAENIVYKEWIKIWDADLPRTFTADFEVYGSKAMQPENAELEIFIAIK